MQEQQVDDVDCSLPGRWAGEMVGPVEGVDFDRAVEEGGNQVRLVVVGSSRTDCGSFASVVEQVAAVVEGEPSVEGTSSFGVGN